MFLLDTNVVSELRKMVAGRANPGVVAWEARTHAGTMFISVMTVMELEIGILLMERRDSAQASILRVWLHDYVLPEFDGRILPVDLAIAHRCAGLHVPDRRAERDAFIAATALVHGLTVVTRNTADFEAPGARLLNPWT
jgi:predicted nucleic acid-binding protein